MILRTATALLLLTVGGFIGYALAAVDRVDQDFVDRVNRHVPREPNVVGLTPREQVSLNAHLTAATLAYGNRYERMDPEYLKPDKAGA